MFNILKKNIIKDQQGQTLAELAIVLSLLILLLVWCFNFYDIFAIKHKTVEAARYAAWEVAYGRSSGQANGNARNIIDGAQTFLNNPSGTQANTSNNSSLGSLFYFNSLGRLRILQLGVSTNNLAQSNTSASYSLTMSPGLSSVTLRNRYALIYNSWDIETVSNGGSSGDDVQNVIANVFYIIPGVGTLLQNSFNALNNALRWPAAFLGQSFDMNPMGHVRLDIVPPPD